MTAVVRDLETLVAFPTVSNRPVTELAAFLARRLEDLGFRVERFVDAHEPGKLNLVASIGPTGTDGLVMSGHMDVVPVEGQPWTAPPFEVTRRGDRLLGRGTADMKGFFAATLQALARIQAAEYHRELVLVWTHDEEVGCVGSARLVDRLKAEPRPLPHPCLIGEPTGFSVLRMHPGHVAIEVVVGGAAAHSSRPDLGVNAIEGAAEAVAAIRAIARELETETAHEAHFDRPWVPVNVARIEGGSAVNIVPDRCRVVVGYRPLPGMAADAVFQRIARRVEGLGWPGGATCRLLRSTPSLLTPDSTALGAILGEFAEPGPASATFATDGGNLAALGMQPLIFGPGSIDVAHKADEYVPVEHLHRSVDILEAVVRSRCC